MTYDFFEVDTTLNLGGASYYVRYDTMIARVNPKCRRNCVCRAPHLMWRFRPVKVSFCLPPRDYGPKCDSLFENRWISGGLDRVTFSISTSGHFEVIETTDSGYIIEFVETMPTNSPCQRVLLEFNPMPELKSECNVDATSAVEK